MSSHSSHWPWPYWLGKAARFRYWHGQRGHKVGSTNPLSHEATMQSSTPPSLQLIKLCDSAAALFVNGDLVLASDITNSVSPHTVVATALTLAASMAQPLAVESLDIPSDNDWSWHGLFESLPTFTFPELKPIHFRLVLSGVVTVADGLDEDEAVEVLRENLEALVARATREGLITSSDHRDLELDESHGAILVGSADAFTEQLVSLPRAVAASLIEMAASHTADISSGLEEGIYETDENLDLPTKEAAIAEAQAIMAALT